MARDEYLISRDPPIYMLLSPKLYKVPCSEGKKRIVENNFCFAVLCKSFPKRLAVKKRTIKIKRHQWCREQENEAPPLKQ
jgi:hypothetical protein